VASSEQLWKTSLTGAGALCGACLGDGLSGANGQSSWNSVATWGSAALFLFYILFVIVLISFIGLMRGWRFPGARSELDQGQHANAAASRPPDSVLSGQRRPPLAVVASLSADDPPEHPGDENQPLPGRRARRTALRWGLVATVAILGVGVAVALVARSAGGQQTASRSLPPQRIDGDLVVTRHWTLSGPGGSRFTEKGTVTSQGGTAVVAFVEPVPAAIAAHLTAVHRSPAASTIVWAGHAVQWQLEVPAHGTAAFRYWVTVPRAGATETRLARWAVDFSSLDAAFNMHLNSLEISRSKVTIMVRQSVHLRLHGFLGDGRPAPEKILSAVSWTITGPRDVATVNASTGVVKGVGKGDVKVIARIGPIHATSTVTVKSAPHSSGPGIPPTSSQVPTNSDTGPGQTGTTSPTATGPTTVSSATHSLGAGTASGERSNLRPYPSVGPAVTAELPGGANRVDHVGPAARSRDSRRRGLLARLLTFPHIAAYCLMFF
jgi:hypothetical protein